MPRVRGVAGLAQAKARPDHPVLGVVLSGTAPRVDGLGDRRKLHLVRVDLRCGRCQRAEPRLDGGATRAAARPRDEPARKARASAGVDDRAQDRREDVLCRDLGISVGLQQRRDGDTESARPVGVQGVR